MADTKATLNNLLKDKGHGENTEVTRFKGEYYLLHICKNGAAVPLFHSKDIADIVMNSDMLPVQFTKEKALFLESLGI